MELTFTHHFFRLTYYGRSRTHICLKEGGGGGFTWHKKTSIREGAFWGIKNSHNPPYPKYPKILQIPLGRVNLKNINTLKYVGLSRIISGFLMLQTRRITGEFVMRQPSPPLPTHTHMKTPTPHSHPHTPHTSKHSTADPPPNEFKLWGSKLESKSG